MLTGKVALVTGATGGLGQHFVRMLSENGAAVVVNFRDRETEARQLVDSMRESGRRAMACCADVSREADVCRMLDDVNRELGPVSVLINNAGISRNAMSWKMTSDVWNDVIGTNLSGVFYMTKAVLPGMREAAWGRVINISSVVAQVGVPGTVAYAASKAGIVGLTRTIAREVISRNITVNTLMLGYFQVGVIETLTEEMQQSIVQQIPAGRLGEPRAAVDAVQYLCSDGAAYVTGQAISVNGGMFMS